MKPILALFSSFFAVLLLSCGDSNTEPNRSAELTDAESYTGLTQDSVKLVKTGSISLKVSDVTKSTRSLSNLSQKLGGIIFDQNIEYAEAARNELNLSNDSILVVTSIIPRAEISVKVPSENLETFMHEVTELGYFTSSRKMHIDDQSFRYLENKLKHKNRKEVLSSAAPKNNSANSTSKTVALKDEMIEEQIGNKIIDADVKYSTVNLHLYQNAFITKEVIANNIISDYQLPFFQRFSNAISLGWQGFLSFILLLTQLWFFIVAGFAVYLLYKYFKPKFGASTSNAKSR